MKNLLRVHIETSELFKKLSNLRREINSRKNYKIPREVLFNALVLMSNQERCLSSLSIVVTREDYKKRVKRFRRALINGGYEIRLMETYELLSRFWGFDSWNVMSAQGFLEESVEI